MCEKCKQIDAKIDHFRKLAACAVDQLVLNGLAIAIADLEAGKSALHPKA